MMVFATAVDPADSNNGFCHNPLMVIDIQFPFFYYEQIRKFYYL